MQMIKQQASEKKTVFPTTTDQICDGHGQHFDIVIFFIILFFFFYINFT